MYATRCRCSLAGRSSLLVLALAACATEHRSQDLEVAGSGVRLAATVLAPERAEPLPAVLLLAGSGPDGRENPYYTMLGQAFVEQGFAVMVYDKRGSGESSGDWRTSPFPALIDDAVAALQALRAHAWIDSTRVGIWGGSEGAGIAPEVAARVPGTAFVIIQSMAGVTFAEQYLHQAAHEFRGRPEDSSAVMQLQHAKLHYARTSTGWSEYEATIRVASGRAYADYASPTTPESWWWAWYATKMSYTPLPLLSQLACPVLAVWGEDDPLIPVEASRAAVRAARRGRSTTRDSLVVIRHAGHTLQVPGLRGFLAGAGLRNRPVHLGLLTTWAAHQVGQVTTP